MTHISQLDSPTKRRRMSLFGGTTLLAAFALSPALAQTTPSSPTPQADTGVETIIVTAQKREERLQDVPVTITVISGRALERQSISNITDLQNATPELNYTGQPSAGYSIRGSGTQTFTRSAENNVSIVVDGVVLGQLTPSTTSLFDIQRAEVLSGPQGMLFGKNASAGVVNITTRGPVIGKREVMGRVSAGEDGYLVAQASLNLPMSDTAALRVTLARDQKDAMITNRFNGLGLDAREATSGRARLLWNMTPNVAFNLIADHEVENGGNGVWVARKVLAGGPTTIAGRLATCGVTPGPENIEVCLDGPSSRKITSSGLSGQFDWTLGEHVLTSISAYRHFSRASDTDSDSRPVNVLNSNFAGDEVDQYSQEIRVTSPSGKALEYVAGVFLYDYTYKALVDQGGTLGALPFVVTRSTISNISQKSYALFGQASFKLSPQFSILAGGRFTRDELDNTTVRFTRSQLGRALPGFTPPDSTVVDAVDTDNFSYRIGAQYRPNDDFTGFITYSRGYKGPAINDLPLGSAAPRIVKPEIPTNIEIGVKGSLFEGKLRGDVTLFDTKVENFQAQIVATVGGIASFVFANASELNQKGVQLNVYANPVRGLSITSGLLYNDATYGSFLVPCNAPFLTGCSAVGAAGNVINAQGRQLANAPKWKFTLGGGYEAPLGENIIGFIDANMVYRDNAFSSATPDANLEIEGYTLFDARLGVKSTSGRWSAALFGRNLTDERAPTIIFRDPLSPTENYMQSYASNAFRVIGVTLQVTY